MDYFRKLFVGLSLFVGTPGTDGTDGAVRGVWLCAVSCFFAMLQISTKPHKAFEDNVQMCGARLGFQGCPALTGILRALLVNNIRQHSLTARRYNYSLMLLLLCKLLGLRTA